MGRLSCVFATVLVAFVMLLSTSASPLREVLGLELASFPGREVLVIRTGGAVSAPTSFSRDAESATLKFLLRDADASGLNAPSQGLSLIRSVKVEPVAEGTQLSMGLSKPELTSQQYFRISQPSDRVILIEVFPAEADKQNAERLTNPEKQLKVEVSSRADKPAAQAPAKPQSKPSASSGFDPQSLGITTVDLRQSDSQKVLGLAAATGLLKLDGTSYVATQGLGEVAVKPAGQSLVGWGSSTPPGELYLSGSPEQIADFLRRADSKLLASQPTLEQVWQANAPKSSGKPASHQGTKFAGRPKYKGDPYSGLYVTHELPGGGQLSDVRVTLPATGGMNLFQVLNYLSQISGISLIIDPYAFDDPTGLPPYREPLIDPTEGQPGGDDGPGFRPELIFDPQLSGSGTVVGNFDNMPFDQALQLILGTHGLQYVVYAGDGSVGINRAPASVNDDYVKPVILVTSKERVQQELAGTNMVGMGQFHYADPTQVTDILGNLSMLPSSNAGWYIYEGSGNNGGGGNNNGGGGNNGGGNNGGGGNAGGGGGGGAGGGGTFGGGRGTSGAGGAAGSGRAGGHASVASPYLQNADSGLLVFRGSNREPIERRVAEAVADGHAVVRVLLEPEQGRYMVTGIALP